MASHFAREMMLAVLLLQLVQYNRGAAASVGLPGCSTTCGNTTIPYPFGIGTGCYFEGFNLTCDHAYQPPKLFFGDGTIEVIEISIPKSIVRLKSTPLTSLPSKENDVGIHMPRSFSLVLNQSVLVAVGCSIIAHILYSYEGPVVACTPLCPVKYTGHTCSGMACSLASANIWMSDSFTVKILPLTLNGSFSVYDAKRNNALLVEQEWLNKHEVELIKYLDPFIDHRDNESMVVPFVLDWSITHNGSKGCLEAKEKNISEYQCHSVHHLCSDSPLGGYHCKCQPGYEGNAYLHNGCEDIDECQFPDMYPCHGTCINVPGTYECYCPKGTHGNASAGQCISDGTTRTSFLIGVAITVGVFLLILAMLVLLYKLKKRKEKILKKKYFLQNRGLLLQQLLCNNEDVAGRTKIFSIEELEMATNKFDTTRLLGRGGHGEVYKGILLDKRVVAIKKSLIAVKSEIDQFINEVAILSQINHRNVVKLFGCCLETEVPLLVYEFISNGTLSERLHVESNCCLSWDDRLRIASETARALAYLHTAAPVSVFHRDIKPVNILLDDTLTAKVSDFGASRSVLIDQIRITTAIQGTYGYLDPEYYHTSRLTDKSDVYSFGVILVELLTRETPHEFSRSEEAGNLVSYFTSLQKDNRLFEILDPKIVHQGQRSELEGVAQLAEMCLRLKGEERPTMREVEMTLEELIRALQKRHAHPWKEESSAEQQKLLQVEGVITTRQFSFEQELENSSRLPR